MLVKKIFSLDKKKDIKKILKIILDISFCPALFIYLSLVKFLTGNFGYKMLPRNKIISSKDINGKFFSFLFECPPLLEYTKDSKNIKIETAALFFNDLDGKLRFKNFSDFFSLDDRFTSFKNISKKKMQQRSSKILIVKTAKAELWGHKKRISLAEKAKGDSRFEILDLSLDFVPDLFYIYEKYRFIVIIENTHFQGYKTEKFYDVVKSGAIPIYHHLIDDKFIHCEIQKENIDNKKAIINATKKFELNNNIQSVSDTNLRNLKLLRDHHISEYIKYQALPFFALSTKIQKKTFLYKIWKMKFR